MKLFVLAALIAAAASSGQLSNDQQQQPWPWQAGKQYQYEVESHTVARLPEGASTGTAFKARFIIRAKPNGLLQAKLENPQHATIHHELLADRVLPTDLKYEAVKNLDKPFEITLNGGRVQTLNLPPTIALHHENLLKGLISALQADLSTHRHISSSQDSFDKETQQGLFRKMETDVTGDCETLYTVSPVASEWRRELPQFVSAEEPIEITKTKNYGHCHHRVAYHFGVPEGAEWTGTASRPDEEQLIKRNTFSRILVGRQGPIYKAETTSTVHVQPHLHGQHEAEVHSHVKIHLVSFEQDNQDQWQILEGSRVINNLLYSMSTKRTYINQHSSEESSEEIEVDVNTNRVRRSASPKIVSINKMMVRNQQYGQGSSSSSSESNSVYVNDNVPNNNEPAYAALYMNPSNRNDMKQNSMNAQRLAQEIAQQLQNPNNMPKSDLLSKFNILVRIIASMSYEQLSQTSNAIEVGKSSNNIVKSDMWMVFRDAVAQAGTLPAFKQIKTWVQNKKLEGEEAAEVLGTLAHTLRYPTKEAMTQFFELAMSPEVRQQQYLHSTALIAATKFINMGQVNNQTAHGYYPTHMYGRLARKHDNFVVDEILPQLRQQLSEAIQQGHSHLTQIYIKAIGNLGHRAILDVFAPYLEGKIPVSIYLRYQMVDNLQVLAYQKDKYVRAVLYSILRNTAEADDVRVAAILNIFMSRPTGAMMQAMAQMTKEDPSVQVRAALKSGIESASQLKNPRYLDLARTAQAARPILTKERFGYQYSFKNYNDYFDGENNFGIFAVFSKIGSEDSLFPQHLQYAWKDKVGGWSRENLISVSTSSAQQLTQYLQQLLMSQQQQQQMYQRQQSEPNHKYPAHKIAQMLNIQRDPKYPLEFSVAINLMNQQRYFAFDQNDMPKLNSAIQSYIAKLKQGVEKHYTKIFNQAQVSIMFPVAMGMPFIYKYKVPTVLHMHAKAKSDVSYEQQHQQYSGSMDKEIQFTFARNIDGSVGFLDTLADHYASVGVINKFQLYAPTKIHAVIKNGEVKINFQPIQPQQDTNIVHFSVWPYSSNQKRDSLTTIGLDPNTKLIARTNKVVSVDSKFGQSTGMAFQVQGYSYSQDYRNLAGIYQSRDVMSNIAYALHQRDVALTHFNFRYLGKQSQNNGGFTFSTAYDTYYNQQEQEGKLVASTPSIVTPNSQERRQEMAKRVSSGINTAKAQVVDLSVVFEGPQKKEFVLTAAIARSPVDNKVQYAFFSSPLQGEGYINAVGTIVLPQTTALNFLETLQKDLKVSCNTDIKFGKGNNGNIHIQAQAERTKKYSEALVNIPLGKECAQEIAKNNYYLSACHKMIVLAHTPDNFKASITYKDVSPIAKYMSFQAWRSAQYLGFWNSDANPLKVTADGKLTFEVQAYYLEKYMNVAVNTRLGEFHIKNVPIPKFSSGVLSTYAPVSRQERVLNYYTQHQYLPFCAVDGTRVRSFSDRQYDYTLSQAWHVVMQDESQQQQANKYHDQLVVLARRPSEDQQEAYVSYRSETGKDLEIQLKPAQGAKKASVQVKTNSKKVSENLLTMYWDEVTDSPLFDYYYMPDGVLMLNIREHRLRVIYDGQRLVIWSDGNRNNTRGICGQMSGDVRDDFQAPHGLVDQPQYYAASFALNEEFSDPKTQELQNKAKQMSYQRQTRHTAILRPDSEWSEAFKNQQTSMEDWGRQTVYRTRSYKKGDSTCQLEQQVQYYENHGEICITTTALPACQSHCNGQGYKVQAAQVVCKPKWDQEYLSFREQIREGQNPKVTGASHIQQYRIPATCSA